MENYFQSDTSCHVRLHSFLKMPSVFPKKGKAKSTSLSYNCMTKPSWFAFNYRQAAFG